MTHIPLFYASQVAACVGLNQYKTKREALEETWKRLDSTSYLNALSRNKKMSDEQHLEVIIEKNADVRDIVKGSVEKLTYSSKEAETTNVHQQASLERIKELTDVERKLVEKSVKTNIFTGYGTRQEINVKTFLKEKHGITVLDDTKFHKKMFKTKAGNAYGVGGKIDGFTEDFTTVVEVKNRVKRLFRKVYPYENVQLQTYLQVLNKDNGLLVECYKGSGTPDIMMHKVKKDDDLWIQTIQPGLEIFTDLLVGLLGDDSLQDRFMSKKA